MPASPLPKSSSMSASGIAGGSAAPTGTAPAATFALVTPTQLTFSVEPTAAVVGTRMLPESVPPAPAVKEVITGGIVPPMAAAPVTVQFTVSPAVKDPAPAEIVRVPPGVALPEITRPEVDWAVTDSTWAIQKRYTGPP